jgi:hypothetical protein
MYIAKYETIRLSVQSKLSYVHNILYKAISEYSLKCSMYITDCIKQSLSMVRVVLYSTLYKTISQYEPSCHYNTISQYGPSCPMYSTYSTLYKTISQYEPSCHYNTISQYGLCWAILRSCVPVKIKFSKCLIISEKHDCLHLVN